MITVLNGNAAILSLLALSLLITIAGGLFVIIKLCNDTDQKEVSYDKRRREQADY